MRPQVDAPHHLQVQRTLAVLAGPRDVVGGVRASHELSVTQLATGVRAHDQTSFSARSAGTFSVSTSTLTLTAFSRSSTAVRRVMERPDFSATFFRSASFLLISPILNWASPP